VGSCGRDPLGQEMILWQVFLFAVPQKAEDVFIT
jgi:hypothetical protein